MSELSLATEIRRLEILTKKLQELVAEDFKLDKRLIEALNDGLKTEEQ